MIFPLILLGSAGLAFAKAWRDRTWHPPSPLVPLARDYVTRPGDTPGSIARTFGTTTQAIVEANVERRGALTRGRVPANISLVIPVST